MSAADERNHWNAVLASKPSEKSWWTAFVLSLVLGLYGADRIYLGSVSLGSLKFLTMGGLCLWWVADFVLLLTNKMRDAEGCVVCRPF